MNYELYSSEALFKLYRENIQTVATAIREVLGDAPFPDPREVAEKMTQMELGQWDSLWLDRDARKIMQDNLALVKIMAQVQTENADILEEMLNRTAPEDFHVLED